MIPTQDQVDRLNTEFIFHGFVTDYEQEDLLIFEEISEVLAHFNKDKTVFDFGDSRDIEMWLEENYGGKIYYSDIQDLYFVIK